MPETDLKSTREAPAAVIRTPDQRLRVFVSSTLQELAAERVAAQEAITYFCCSITSSSWFQPGLSFIRLHLGNIAFTKDALDAAYQGYEACHALGQELGDRWITASAINNFGELARYQGEDDQAEEHYYQSRELFQSVHSSPDLARADHSLAWIALHRGDPVRARALLEAALAEHQRVGIQPGACEGAGKGIIHLITLPPPSESIHAASQRPFSARP